MYTYFKRERDIEKNNHCVCISCIDHVPGSRAVAVENVEILAG